MRDLALDPVTGDLALSRGDLRLTEPGAESVGQGLRIRLRFIQGEWHLDTRVGVPIYTDVMGRQPAGAVEALYRRIITTAPGVATLDRYDFAIGTDRRGTLDFEVHTTEGEVVTINNFIVGAS